MIHVWGINYSKKRSCSRSEVVKTLLSEATATNLSLPKKNLKVRIEFQGANKLVKT